MVVKKIRGLMVVRTFVVMVLLLSSIQGAMAQLGAVNRQREPQLRGFFMSHDGKRIGAAHYVAPMNRPGTDWDSWVTVFDSDTRKVFKMVGLHGTMGFSSDGAKVAATGYREGQGHSNRRLDGVAVWDVEGGDVRVLPMDERGLSARGAVCSLLFSRDGSELFAAIDDGCVLVWDLKKGEACREVYRIMDAPESHRAGRFHLHLYLKQQSVVALAGNCNTVEQMMPPALIEMRKSEGAWSMFRKVELDQSEGHRIFREMIDAEPIGAFLPGMMLHQIDTLLTGVKVSGPDWRSSWGLPSDGGLAIHPGEELYAIRDQGAVVVRRFSGQAVFHLPALDVKFFSNDGRYLVTTDRDQLIRVWDMRSGRLSSALDGLGVKSGTVRVAAIQAHSEFGKVAENKEKLLEMIGEAARSGARIVVMPEAAIHGYASDDLGQAWQVKGRNMPDGVKGVSPENVAWSLDAPGLRDFAERARAHGIYLTVPFVEVDHRTDRYFNAVVLFDPAGQRVIHYRKRDRWPAGDLSWASAGDLGLPVVDTPFGRLGCLICFDIHKQAEKMGKLGVDILLYSIAWVDQAESDWFDSMLPQIASDNEFEIIAANWSVPEVEEKVNWHGFGQTRIIDRTGKIVAKTASDHGDQISYGDLPIQLGED
jgi:predicted amidohydrolase/WD40 repeat protein